MTLNTKRWIVAVLSFFLLASLLIVAYKETQRELAGEMLIPVVTAENSACMDCHSNDSPALVQEWEQSKHAKVGIGCIECHSAEKGEVDAWKHEGAYISTLVTPLDCAECHEKQYDEFENSPHAKAGEVLAKFDEGSVEMLGLIGNHGGSINSCEQCHGSMIKFERDSEGEIIRLGSQKKPIIKPDTWPNSGMGRLNPDGSKGSCHACHSRHAFEAKLSRSPETCGKCHTGPSHPQIEIYNESKHGIAFYSNRARMNLDKRGEWVLGRDYSAAPTCATCHISSYMTSQGLIEKGSHDVGERISWSLRPVVSTLMNLVKYEDGYKEEIPDTTELPDAGDEVVTKEYVIENEKLVLKEVPRTVEEVIYSDDRREKMIGACLNCHNDTFVDNFYEQYDTFVETYNENFGAPAKAFMDELATDGVISPNSPWEKDVQWIYWELWNREGREARHGTSMMGPSFARKGMFKLSRNFYTKFLPAVIDAAAEKSPEMKKKYQRMVEEELSRPVHNWFNRLP